MRTFHAHIVSSPQRLAREICADIMATEDEIEEAISAAIAYERKACADLVASIRRSLPNESGFADRIATLSRIEDAIRNRKS